MPKASLHVAKSGGRDAALRRPVGAARRPYSLRRQHRRERYLAVDGLLENFLNGRSDF